MASIDELENEKQRLITQRNEVRQATEKLRRQIRSTQSVVVSALELTAVALLTAQLHERGAELQRLNLEIERAGNRLQSAYRERQSLSARLPALQRALAQHQAQHAQAVALAAKRKGVDAAVSAQAIRGTEVEIARLRERLAALDGDASDA